MTGTVALLNPITGKAAILVNNGEHTILEMLDDIGLALGDTISGSLESIGETVIITNTTTGITGSGWIDDIYLDRQTAIQALQT